MEGDIECADQINKTKSEVGYKSGQFILKMGLWQDCADSGDGMSYYLANIINNATKLNATMFLGLCLPSVCSQSFVQDLINEELHDNQKKIVQMLKFPLAVKGIDINPQQYVNQPSGWFYFTITFLMLVVSLSIFSLFWSRKKKEKYSGVDKIIQSFNIAESMKIFKYKNNYLNIFNGVKVIFMFWVILGHTYSVRLKNNVNFTGLNDHVQTFFSLFVLTAFVGVDVFFFIGGFLVAYSFMREKSKSILKYPLAILHRVLRFWPSYIVAILLYYSVYIHTNSGPIWQMNWTLGQIPYCEGAWKSLFFIDNLVDNGEKICMAWGWYLQNDMQIFVFSLIFIFIYTKNKRVGYISLIAMAIFGLVFNYVEVVKRQIHQVTHLIDFIKWGEYFTNIYIKPWIRCPPYIMGLIFGLQHMEYLEIRKKMKEQPDNESLKQNFFVKLREKMLKQRWVSWISQIIGLGLMTATILAPRDMQLGNTWPQSAHGFYLSIQKISFTFGIYLAILPTLLQVPNFTYFMLDNKFFNFLSKISFCVYLLHFMVVEYVHYGEKTDFYYSSANIFPLYLGIVCLSLFFGFLATIFIEVPFSKLEKMLFSVLMKKKDRKVIPQNAESLLIVKDSIAGESSIITSTNGSSLLSSVNSENEIKMR